jgi:hypothetical protein
MLVGVPALTKPEWAGHRLTHRGGNMMDDEFWNIMTYAISVHL